VRLASRHDIVRLHAPFLAGCFAALLFAFVWTRGHSLAELGFGTLPATGMRLRALFSGVLSDAWISALLALPLSVALLPLTFWRARRLALAASFTLLVLVALSMGFLIGCHVLYVEFFGGTLSWQHLRYLGDPGFVRASADAFLDGQVVGCAAGAAVVAALSWLLVMPLTVGHLGTRARRFLPFVPLALLAFGGLCQVVKVQANTLKWGWHVPSVLRLNFLESAAVQWWRAEKMPLLDEPSIGLLRAHAGVPVDSPVKDALEAPFRPAQSDGPGGALVSVVRHRLLSGQPIYVFLLQLESFRPEESRTYHPDLPETNTPTFDALAQESIVYENLFTAGGVTRAGQEALLCGLLSGEWTSAMRDLPSAAPRCLPRLLKDALGPRKVYAAWWHGGDFNFDSQGTFWQRQGMDAILSREDFAAQSDEGASAGADAYPGTWWGVSDFTLVERMKRDLLVSRPEARVFLHTFLSVTNHPGWTLPVDAPVSWYRGEAEKWDRYKPLLTTRYTDEALNRLVNHLKDTVCYLCQSGSLWDNALVIVSNDHGSLMPSLRAPEGYAWGRSPELDVAAARAASHGAFLLTGGMTASAMRGLGLSMPVRDTTVRSQLDVFATIVDAFGIANARTVGDSLFARERRWPVAVDLGARVYFPDSAGGGRVVDREGLLKGTVRASDEPGEASLRRAYFLGLSHLLAEGLAGR
jgi:hypothetical protein